MRRLNREQFLELLRRKQGKKTQTEFAKELGVTKQCLSAVFKGLYEPGPAIYHALGLEREVFYYTKPQ